MKQKLKLMSLAQTLSGIELEKLIGRRVIIDRIRRRYRGGKRIREGTVVELAKTPGFVLIEDDKGGLYTRAPSQLYERLKVEV
jgi:hypothetical protein